MRRSFYRAGGLEKATDYGAAHASYVLADSVKPEGRVGRLEGIFCVESVAEMTRWVSATAMAGPAYDPNPREIFYEGPEPWVYPVIAWSSMAMHEREGAEAYRTHYWDLGLRLSEFEERRSELTEVHVWIDGGEILLDPRYIRSSRPVSLKRLAEHGSAGFPEAVGRLKAWRRRYGSASH